MSKLLLIAFIFMVGCTSTGLMTMTVEKLYPNGVVERTEIALKPPTAPLGDSYITSDTNGLRMALSGSQSEAGIQRVKGDSRNKGIMYGGCALLLVLGMVAFALPNGIVSNKDGLIISGVGLAGFAALRWIEASSPVMMWVLPIALIGGGVWLLLQWK
ncbi:MAG: hypothetical protein ACYTFK_13950, partial [Planctomycetota bacterium]